MIKGILCWSDQSVFSAAGCVEPRPASPPTDMLIPSTLTVLERHVQTACPQARQSQSTS